MRETSLILGNRRRVRQHRWQHRWGHSIDGVRSFNIALQVANDKGPGSMYIFCVPGILKTNASLAAYHLFDKPRACPSILEAGRELL